MKKIKNTAGDFNRWITKFEDQIETCETIGVDLLEEAKILYFMNNLNDTIFGDVKANFMDLSTRALFPHTYEEIKQRMIAEYSQISTRTVDLRQLSRSFVARTASAMARLVPKPKRRDAISAGHPGIST